MWTLVAYSPADGWSVVRSRGRFSILRPPYLSRHLSNVTEDAVQRLLTEPDFVLVKGGKDFDNLAQLVTFLNAQILEWRQKSGTGLQEAGFGKELLARAPREILERFLQKVESELISSNRLDAAESAIVTFLEVPTVINDADLFYQAVSLLKSIPKRRQDRYETLEDAELAAFPLACSQYGRNDLINFMAEVSRRRSLFAFAKVRG